MTTPYTNKYEDKTEDEKKVIALAMHLMTESNTFQGQLFEDLPEDEKQAFIDDAQKAIDDYDYEVYTDEEADEKWDEELDNYIDECIMPEFEKVLPNMWTYFDSEAWKRDARFDGRGHSLSHYDGVENYEEVDRETYYIYRQN